MGMCILQYVQIFFTKLGMFLRHIHMSLMGNCSLTGYSCEVFDHL